MLKIQQVKTKDTQYSQTRKVVIFDDSFEMNLIVSYELSSGYYRLVFKGDKSLKKLGEDGITKINYDKKIYHMGKFEITKTFSIENFYKNEKNVATYYSISGFLDKFIEELKNYEEKNS